MKILIAADSFKNALDSLRVCRAIERGLNKGNPLIQTQCFPMADGGEGTIDILAYHLGGKKRELMAVDPLFRPIKTDYLISEDGKTVFIEMAKTSGLQLLIEKERNPLLTTTFGLGKIILDAINLGIKNIILAIGGSATNDAGIGMATALGYKFYDKDHLQLKGIGEDLLRIIKIEISAENQQLLSDVSFSVICDVRNPLYGPEGAAHIYSRQKGATDDDILVLDKGLKKLADVTNQSALASTEGAGAAGGLGFGAMAFLNATLYRGIDLIIDITHFEQHVLSSDIIITGEGKLDNQTSHGKLIYGITTCASKYNKPVIALCGSIDITPEYTTKLGLQAAFSIIKKPCNLNQAIAETEKDLEAAAFNIAQILSLKTIIR